jgi:hypothetical protein
MNKIKKTILAVTGGFNIVFKLLSPILLWAIVVTLFDISKLSYYLLFSVGVLASLFEGLKLWWLKE